MSDDQRDRYVEELLDASLARYSQAEPRPGLEERLLAKVRSSASAGRRPTLWSWYLAPAAAVAAVMLMVGIVLWRREDITSPAPKAPVVAVNPGPAPAASGPAVAGTPPAAREAIPLPPARLGAGRPSAAGRLAATPSRPRREVFPSPEPLSDRDRALLGWIQGAQPALEELLGKLPVADQAPGKILVAELQIPVLAIEPIAVQALEPGK
jgi:hypothetical protein